MKSLVLFIAGNMTFTAMWAAGIIAQSDTHAFGVNAAVGGLIAAGFGAIWLKLWQGQNDLLKAKDLAVVRAEQRCEQSDEMLRKEREYSSRLEDKLHEAGMSDKVHEAAQ